ncbi:sulfatase family protein [Pseudohoeflea coraliihabitans]|uniref:Sulfatase-like hydrolase/transferase n=1 Tax=Pseudohoeflea coraliihabitans TaxID=2860393 RepID=A0ABS6WLM9_9HYPH|nr:sulfatase-like hydrolase/transferase [Pseudohoeflea sp. DP4N28-3]MBW3096030.1 sulfatase-like hydrolase/transferase [Pseudohoeflea sp. DP4N28-3]
MPTKPNIIFIITDQQRYDTIAEFGYDFMETPNLDRLAREGVYLSACYAAAPSCVPARASLFTGHYPHTTGVVDNAATWRHTWVEDLAEAGYHCVNIGKMHTQPMDTPAGFHARMIVENKDRSMAKRGADFVDEWDKAIRKANFEKPGLPSYRLLNDYADRLGAFEWPLPDELHSDNFVGSLAVDWIQEKRSDKPLFLQVGFPGPHPPYDPPAHEVERYLSRELPIDPVRPGDVESQPRPFRELVQKHVDGDHDSVRHKVDASAEERRRQRAYYLANVTMIDREVGRIIDALDETGRLEDTIIVFTSDHGDMLGDHGHSQKWSMYEQVIRLPIIIWSSRGFKARGRLDPLVQHMDIAPTLFDLAGLEKPSSWEAVSFADALNDDAFEGRYAVYCEQGRDVVFRFSDFVSMVRTRRWKYVHFLGEDFGQLFDLESDPGEYENRWDDPACAAIRDEMEKELMNWRIRSGYKAREWAEKWR